MLCLKDFHQLSQNLLLCLASAESQRQEAHVADPKADPQVLLERQRKLMVSASLGASALPPASVHPLPTPPQLRGQTVLGIRGPDPLV